MLYVALKSAGLQQLTMTVTRYISITSRLTGWNAVKSRVVQLGYELTDDQVKEVYVATSPEHRSG